MTERSIKRITVMTPLSKMQFEAIREESRNHIMNTALELISRKGFYNTSVGDIAKHAGISKGLMYNYFKSKDELLKEIVMTALNKIVEVLKPAQTIPEPHKRLEFLVRTNFKLVQQNPDYWRMFMTISLQLDRKGDLHALISSYWDMLFENAITIFREMGKKRYVAEAHRYGAEVDGMVIHFLLLGDKYPLKKNVNLLIQNYCQPK